MDSARGKSAQRDLAQQSTVPDSADRPMIQTELLLDCLESGGRATAVQLAEQLGAQPEDVSEELTKLDKLDLVVKEFDQQGTYYKLTDYGQRARQFAKMG